MFLLSRRRKKFVLVDPFHTAREALSGMGLRQWDRLVRVFMCNEQLTRFFIFYVKLAGQGCAHGSIPVFINRAMIHFSTFYSPPRSAVSKVVHPYVSGNAEGTVPLHALPRYVRPPQMSDQSHNISWSPARRKINLFFRPRTKFSLLVAYVSRRSFF